MTDVLDDLRWLRRVTEDDTRDIYGRAIAEIERLRAAIAMRCWHEANEDWLSPGGVAARAARHRPNSVGHLLHKRSD